MDTQVVRTALRGRDLLADPRLNKGTAFTDDERQSLGLVGLLPDSVETIEQQLVRTRHEYDRLHNDLERHVYLRGLQDHNEVLFYRFLRDNMSVATPIVYTPTVGQATQEFSRIYRRSQGLFLSWRTRDSMRAQFESLPDGIEIVVATDGERILGLGDQGVGGIGIPNGKLALYSAFGGIDPAHTLPVILDVGTNNQAKLSDPTYLGWRHERVTGADYDSFVDQFVSELKRRYPRALLQWEDFANHNATRLLDRYRDQILSFNDDIEGTAAVALAAIWSASRSTGRKLTDEVFCIVGAGSAGTGIATMLVTALAAEGSADPLNQIVLVDRQGALHAGRTDLEPFQKNLAHHDATLGGLELANLIERVGATVLIGVTGKGGLFTEPVVRSLLTSTDRPIVMPLSNPTRNAEATPSDILAWTNGQAIVATGSPFDDVTVGDTTHTISQANNVYIFPGLGLGLIAVGARKVTSSMLMAAARAVHDVDQSSDPNTDSSGASVLPPLESVPAVSRRIATAVARIARDEGLTEFLTDAEIEDQIDRRVWEPGYSDIRPA